MDNLSSNQRAFIRMMKDGEEFEHRGFELLLKRPDFDRFFEALANEGMFDPERIQGPVAGDKPGYYRFPYWPPRAYLEAVAKRAGERRDLTLSDKVLGVIRDVTKWRDVNNQPHENPDAWHAFAQYLALLPTSSITLTDIGLTPAWLDGPFRQPMVGYALAIDLLPRLLTSGNLDDLVKASNLLYHCTAVEFVGTAGSEAEKKTTEIRTSIEDHWLKKLVDEHAGILGRKLGAAAADVFQTRVKEVFAGAMNGHETWVFRPAIEDHQQNHEWRGAYNRLVEGLRDIMLAWIDSDAEASGDYVDGMLSSGSEIVERVAVHLIDQRFETLRHLVSKAISSLFFDSGHLHEVYRLLKNHFQQFTEEEQTKIIDAVRGLPLPERGENSLRAQQVLQRSWLSAIASHGHEAADSWSADLNNTLGPVGSFFHPDFNSYIESGWGFDPSPHNVDELVAFARNGIIVEKLNAFVPTNAWDGPSIRSLADAVVDAVGADPHTFVHQLPIFLQAKPEYQYAVIAGFKKLWDVWDGKQEGLRWDYIWPKLFVFFETLLSDNKFGNEEVVAGAPLSPTRAWIPPVISELLRAGMRSDEKAFAPDLLPRTLPLVVILLGISEPKKEPPAGDALNFAINTAKGKAIEALLDYALRSCRMSNKADKIHGVTWQELEPLFDKQIAACQNGNFEFSALAGAYITNLYYMSETWVSVNFTKIFPIEFSANCWSALDGLVFAGRTMKIYAALASSGVLDWALRQDLTANRAREDLLQRVGLAYLWDQEPLDGPRYSYVFKMQRDNDLSHLVKYFWMVRSSAIEEKQKDRILLFWERCVTWAESLDFPPASLLSDLSRLACYLAEIDQRALICLLAVAPHAAVNYNADRLTEDLVRFAAVSPQATGKVLRALLKTYRPTYDFNDKLKHLIAQLADFPESRDDAIVCVECVRYLPGMIQLYSQLTLPVVTSLE